MTTHLYADSLGFGTGASQIGVTDWFSKFLAAAGRSGVNHSRQGGRPGDSAMEVHNTTLAAGDDAILAFGVNERATGFSAAGLPAFIDCLRHHAVRLSAPSFQTARAGGVEVGSWQDTPIMGIGRMTSENGAKKIWTVADEVAHVGVLILEANAGDAYYTIKVDGVQQGGVYSNGVAGIQNTYCAPVSGITSVAPYPYTERLHRIACPGAGQHVIELEKTGGGTLYVQSAPLRSQTARRNVYICDIPYSADYSTWGGSPAGIDLYNNAITALVAELVADGWPVQKIGFNAVINPAVHTDPDGLHRNDAGYLVMSQAAKAVIAPSAPAPAPPPAPTPGKTYIPLPNAYCVEDSAFVYVSGL